MIIECVKCAKKFDVDSDLIPTEGRTIQCGSCDHIWFFKKTYINQSKLSKQLLQDNIKDDFSNKISKKAQSKSFNETNDNINKPIPKKIFNETPKNDKLQSKTNFTFFKFLAYILVLLVSFIGLIIILDTFKSLLYIYFPNLEFLLFNLFETLKDIRLFIIDLI